MTISSRPVVLSVPEPRSLDLIFSDSAKATLLDGYQLIEATPKTLSDIPAEDLAKVRYIIGQPTLSMDILQKLTNLRCIFNVESNLLDNMPYDYLFEKGIHVVTTGAVFAEPVAEIGLAMALSLARQLVETDAAFRLGTEAWGLEGNRQARLLSGSDIGIIGFGDLGKSLVRLLSGFRATIRIYDPWLPDSAIKSHGAIPETLNTVLSVSETVFVVAAVTSDNQHFLGAEALSRLKPGASLVLLSRAEVVDFDALQEAVKKGALFAASDVYPVEPVPQDHPIRSLEGFIHSPHRAGALNSAFKQMGDMVLEDMLLLDQGLPPMSCKRAERETVALMRSKPVEVN